MGRDKNAFVLVHARHAIVEGAQATWTAAEVILPATTHRPGFLRRYYLDDHRRHWSAKRAENLTRLDHHVFSICPGMKVPGPRVG